MVFCSFIFALGSCEYVNIFWQCRKVLTNVTTQISQKTDPLDTKEKVLGYLQADCLKNPDFTYTLPKNPHNMAELCAFLFERTKTLVNEKDSPSQMTLHLDAACRTLLNEKRPVDTQTVIITGIIAGALLIVILVLLIMKCVRLCFRKSRKTN
ncbi:hypothetical protein BLNAU_13222 [Blattamonas nauphoetae]|uniref:Uncharacterized protein n=1 Tax=Blattamonas nauphoetae TaxID=2049346 RepID=A0ABQ9XML0_9EUKA|nr:hypothetical protein BLNAU_13222 [Blattamonas nauphoetae]